MLALLYYTVRGLIGSSSHLEMSCWSARRSVRDWPLSTGGFMAPFLMKMSGLSTIKLGIHCTVAEMIISRAGYKTKVSHVVSIELKKAKVNHFYGWSSRLAKSGLQQVGSGSKGLCQDDKCSENYLPIWNIWLFGILCQILIHISVCMFQSFKMTRTKLWEEAIKAFLWLCQAC